MKLFNKNVNRQKAMNNNLSTSKRNVFKKTCIILGSALLATTVALAIALPITLNKSSYAVNANTVRQQKKMYKDGGLYIGEKNQAFDAWTKLSNKEKTIDILSGPVTCFDNLIVKGNDERIQIALSQINFFHYLQINIHKSVFYKKHMSYWDKNSKYYEYDTWLWNAEFSMTSSDASIPLSIYGYDLSGIKMTIHNLPFSSFDNTDCGFSSLPPGLTHDNSADFMTSANIPMFLPYELVGTSFTMKWKYLDLLKEPIGARALVLILNQISGPSIFQALYQLGYGTQDASGNIIINYDALAQDLKTLIKNSTIAIPSIAMAMAFEQTIPSATGGYGIFQSHYARNVIDKLEPRVSIRNMLGRPAVDSNTNDPIYISKRDDTQHFAINFYFDRNPLINQNAIFKNVVVTAPGLSQLTLAYDQNHNDLTISGFNGVTSFLPTNKIHINAQAHIMVNGKNTIISIDQDFTPDFLAPLIKDVWGYPSDYDQNWWGYSVDQIELKDSNISDQMFTISYYDYSGNHSTTSFSQFHIVDEWNRTISLANLTYSVDTTNIPAGLTLSLYANTSNQELTPLVSYLVATFDSTNNGQFPFQVNISDSSGIASDITVNGAFNNSMPLVINVEKS